MSLPKYNEGRGRKFRWKLERKRKERGFERGEKMVRGQE